MSNFTPLSIMKQVVTAKTRSLSSRWMFEDSTPRIQVMSLHELVKSYFIQYAGTRVEIYDNEVEAKIWLKENALCNFTIVGYESEIITPARLKAELERRYGVPATSKLGPTYPNVQHISLDMAEAIQQELAQTLQDEFEKEFLRGMGILGKQPTLIVHFMDPQEALRFKLSWGGDA